MIKTEGGAKNYTHVITVYRYPGDPFPSLSCCERVTVASKMKKKIFHLRSWISFVSQTEEVMYSGQEKSYGSEIVMQIFMILGYLNFLQHDNNAS